MKRLTIVIIALMLLSVLLLSGCGETEELYTKSDIDEMISELEAKLSEQEEQTADALSLLRTEYDAEVKLLEAKILANETKISALTTEYNAKVAELEKADADNAAALAKLKADYEAKIAELEAADAANNTKITELTNAYNAKVAELEGSLKSSTDTLNILITELKECDEATSEIIEAMKAQIDTILAAMEKQYHTVTFVTDGDTAAPEAQSVIDGKKAMKPADPAKKGYIFDGWYIDGEKWSFIGYVVTEDIELVAAWVECTEHAYDLNHTACDKCGAERPPFTVTFKANGALPAPKAQSVFYGEKANEPELLSNVGYIFDGWYYGDDKWSFADCVVTEDIELVAVWIECIDHKDDNEDDLCDKCGADCIPTDVYYSDFGAVGDGQTDDFFAIKACHDYANRYGCTVHAEPGATYYIGDYLKDGDPITSIIIQTDTNWHGCTFIFDDSVVSPNTPCSNSPIFEIESSHSPVRYSGTNLQVETLTKGATNLGGWAPGVECLVYITNSNERHYIRYGLNANNGSSQQEIIYVHTDGTIDPSTPLQWDYEVITSLTVYPCDSKPITVTGGDGDERVTIKTIFNGAPSRYTYYQRNIRITRSNVTLQNIDHLVEGEVPYSQGGTGAPYSGFTSVQYANNVTIQNMLIHDLASYGLETNSSIRMGTYEINASYANNVLWKSIRQDVFFNEDGSVSYKGVMATNYCKNLTFDGNFISSFDAHCGVYNSTIRNSTIEHLNFIGDGLITIENCTVYVDGSGCGINLRSDYGSTWRGDVYMKDVDLKYETRKNKTVSLISSAWSNHSFGYTCYLPQNIHIENVRMLGFTVTVDELTKERDEKIVEINEKELYLFSPRIYSYTDFDISDPNENIPNSPNDWVKCTCATRPDSEFKNPDTAMRSFNDTDGDGRCNNSIVGPSLQSVWCWGFEETPDSTVNANPYIGTKSVTVVNKDPSNPLNIVWPLTPQFKDMDVTVDGVLIIEDGEEVNN